MQAAVGSQCVDCVRAARPPAVERARRWNASQPLLVTYVIIAINVAVLVLAALQGAKLLDGEGTVANNLGLFGPFVADGEWYRVVTAGFVHAGIIHLAMNMWVLWTLGRLLEPTLGHLRFAALYGAGMLAGAAGALVVDPNALTVGASGAIFGLLAAAAVGLRHRGVDIWRSGIGQVLVINLVFTFAVPGISIGGHIGGLIGGGLAGWVLLHPLAPRRAPMDLLGPLAVALVSLMVCAVAVS